MALSNLQKLAQMNDMVPTECCIVYGMRQVQVTELAEVRRLIRTGEAQRIREKNQLSLAEVGRSLGCTGPAVSRWESGDRLPRGDLAVRYGRLLTQLRGYTDRDETTAQAVAQ
jgi:DNA-binding transcriptional regulator YiaG